MAIARKLSGGRQISGGSQIILYTNPDTNGFPYISILVKTGIDVRKPIDARAENKDQSIT